MARPKSIENRSQLILDAAEQLFARYGYERTSIDDIAKHLGIGKGSIYLEFSTKQDILVEILRRWAGELEQRFRQHLYDVSDSPLQVLKDALIEKALIIYERVSRDFHTPEALLHTSIEMKSRFADHFDRKCELLTAFLQKAAEAGEIKPDVATRETAVTLMVGMTSIYPPYLVNCLPQAPLSKDVIRDRAERLLTVLLNGLKNLN